MKHSEGRLRLDVPCGQCGSEPTDSYRSLWFLRGRVVYATYGARAVFGCGSCVKKRAWRSFGVNLIGGWWSLPWGVLNPAVLAQNALAALFRRSAAYERARLTELFENVGFAIADLEIGEDGLTSEARRVVDFLPGVLRGAMESDGASAESEIEYAARVLMAAGGSALSIEDARRRLTSPHKPADPRAIDFESRIAILEMAIGVTRADGSLVKREVRFLHELGSRLGLPASFVDHLIQGASASRGRTAGGFSNDELQLARTTLGIGESCPLAEVKRRYRELIIGNHPDAAGNRGAEREQAVERTKLLNWSYDLLRREAFARAGEAC